MENYIQSLEAEVEHLNARLNGEMAEVKRTKDYLERVRNERDEVLNKIAAYAKYEGDYHAGTSALEWCVACGEQRHRAQRAEAEVKRLHKIERLVRQYIDAPGQERGGVYRLLVWTMEGDPRATSAEKEE